MVIGFWRFMEILELLAAFFIVIFLVIYLLKKLKR
jgi:hypothetical protein